MIWNRTKRKSPVLFKENAYRFNCFSYSENERNSLIVEKIET